MGTIYQDQADEMLAKLAASKVETFKEALDEACPGWRGSAVPLQGYTDPRHHANVAVSRALHDVLPAPFNALEYKWMNMQGFEAIVSYAEAAGRKKQEIQDLVAAAIERNEFLKRN